LSVLDKILTKQIDSKNISSAQVLFKSSLAKVRSWQIAGKPSCHHSRSWGLLSFINTQSMLSEYHHWYM